MKKLILLCGFIALAACTLEPKAAPGNVTDIDVKGDHAKVDECPRADGEPCR